MTATFGKDTPIMMHDGTIKAVQDIKVGDQLMGPDSLCKTVLSLSTGKTMLYNIIPANGDTDTYTVSKNHILSLKYSKDLSEKMRFGAIINIPILEYLTIINLDKGRNLLSGYRVAIDYPNKELELDPYFLGYYLGNNKIHKTADECSSLEKLSLNTNIHIPANYTCNSQKLRLHLLAGIIDSMATLVKNKYEIIHPDEILVDDIIYVCRSLGFATHKTTTTTGHKIYIHGQGIDDIPVRSIKTKMFRQKPADVANTLLTEIIIRKKYVDCYYSFTTDGNQRTVLGDFTVL